MNLRLFFLLVFSFLLKNSSRAQEFTTVKLIDFPENQKLFLFKREMGSSVPVDSFITARKEYIFRIPSFPVSSFVIQMSTDRFKKVEIPFTNQGEELSIHYLPNKPCYTARFSPCNYRVIGSAENWEYYEFTTIDVHWCNSLIDLFDKRDSPAVQANDSLLSLYRDSVSLLNRQRDSALYDFINDHRSSYASLDFFSREANRLPYVPRLAKLFDSLDLKLKETPEGRRVNDIFHPHVAVGKKALNICEPDTSDMEVCLDSILDSGKEYILIDFWASWCGPCLQNFKTLKSIYAKNSPLGFEVLSISIDDDRGAWLAAIKQGNYKWLTVSELKGELAKSILDYGVYQYPTNFLVDRDGILIARDLSMDDLQVFLAENLK